jgi:hypothetical protein
MPRRVLGAALVLGAAFFILGAALYIELRQIPTEFIRTINSLSSFIASKN